MNIIRLKKLGEGAYGKVYSAKYDDTLVAVKRNYSELNTSGISNLIELDMLNKLRDHPMILKLISVNLGEIFPKSTLTPAEKDRKDDKLSFIMEYFKWNGSNFFKDKSLCSPEIGCYLVVQLLLAVEYTHAKGVCHRDLKPENILIKKDEDDYIWLNICDFGMSKILSPLSPSTPGVITCAYRAPEVCSKMKDYDFKVDMWSVGCIIYEIFSENGLICCKDGNDEVLFNEIINKLPMAPDRELMMTMMKNSDRHIPANIPIKRKKYTERMKMSFEYARDFKNKVGPIESLEELLQGLLCLDPKKRISASEALESKFFDYWRSFINNVRQEFPPIKNPYPKIKIITCNERSWMIQMVFIIYNNRKQLAWYNHKILFHAIEIFDRYIVHLQDKKPTYSFPTNNNGYHLSNIQVKLRFYVCIYMIHKYFSVMSIPYEWSEIVESKFTADNHTTSAMKFEEELIDEVLKQEIYLDTIYECQPSLDEIKVRNLLEAYGRSENWEGNLIDLYNKLST